MSARTWAAADAEDLEIISAQLQDAVARVGDFVYLPKKRRFVGLFNRFKWEEKDSAQRVRTGLYFDSVLAARARNLKRGLPDSVVSLLAIRFAPAGSGGRIELLFSGGGAIALEVECLEAGLRDLSGPWAARGRPVHEIGGG